MDLIDTREMSQHTTKNLNKKNIKGAFNIPAYELYKMKKEDGLIPSNASMVDQEILDALKKIYKSDIELYKQKFSSKNLFQI